MVAKFTGRQIPGQYNTIKADLWQEFESCDVTLAMR